jgi:hypothetical protein
MCKENNSLIKLIYLCEIKIRNNEMQTLEKGLNKKANNKLLSFAGNKLTKQQIS